MEILNDNNKSKVGRKKDDIRSYYVNKDKKLCCSFENCKKEFSLKTSALSLRYHIH